MQISGDVDWFGIASTMSAVSAFNAVSAVSTMFAVSAMHGSVVAWVNIAPSCHVRTIMSVLGRVVSIRGSPADVRDLRICTI